jgi:hypothetical protein
MRVDPRKRVQVIAKVRQGQTRRTGAGEVAHHDPAHAGVEPPRGVRERRYRRSDGVLEL